MRRKQPALFRGRHFEAEIIILCVRWCLRFGLSLRNLEELMAERNVSVDHVTIWRWVQRYAPELHQRCRPELRMTNRSWRVDETYLRISGKWTYLYRAPPIDYSPAVLRMPFGFRLATDTLPSGRLQAQRLQVPLGCIRLSPSCPCRVLHTFSTLPANEELSPLLDIALLIRAR